MEPLTPKNEAPKLGQVEPICPYCEARFESKPTRKRKCPQCGKPVFVKTRPCDRQKVLLREDEVSLLETQWEEEREAKEIERRWGPDFEKERKVLERRFGRPPPFSDVKWSLLNRELMDHAREGNWGFYRNTRMEMAKLLRKQRKDQEALQVFLEVCYLDLNGPQNLCGARGGFLGRKLPPFNPRDALPEPPLAFEVKELAENLSLSTPEIEEAFFRVAFENQRRLRLPVRPEAAWKKIRAPLD